MRNTDLTNEPLASDPAPAPRRGNHFSSGPSSNGGDAASARGAARAAGASSAATRQRTVAPDETAAYTSAYFASAQQAPTANAGRTTHAAGASASATGAQPTTARHTAQPQAAQPVAATPVRATQAPRIASGSGGNGGNGYGGAPHSSYYDQQPPRKRGRGKLIAGIVGAVLAVIVVVGGVCGFFMLRDYQEINAQVPNLMEEAGSLKDAVMAGDGETVRNTAAEIAGQVSDIHNRLEGIPWKLASFVPVVGSDVNTVRTVVAEADRLCQYALIPACDSLGDLNLSNLMTDGAINVGLLQSLADTLQSVAPVVEQSAETIADLPEPNIGKVREVVTKVQGVFEKANSAVTAINEIAPYLPQMLGADGVRHYLLVAQNNVELRSTGGFPGSVGVMSVSNGAISLGDFVSVGTTADGGLHWYDQAGFGVTSEEIAIFGDRVGKIPADTPFIYDFPRAYSLFTQMYLDQKGGSIDGVIAIDPVFLQYMLQITGGVDVNGVAVNGDNAASLLMHDAYNLFDTDTQDAFFSAVAGAAFNNMMSNLGNVSLTDLLGVLERGIPEGRFRVWMANEDEEKVIEKLGMSGAVETDPTTPQLGFYVADDTASKISWYISLNTTINSSTKNADGSTTYNVTSTITNNLTPAEAANQDQYITGYSTMKRDVTDMLNRVYIAAPAGGTISDVTVDGYSNGGGLATYNGNQVYVDFVQTLGGATTTFTYNVTTSPEATEELTIVQTPTAQGIAGWQ
ncbi:DUF4012 domain-containing protein [Collinsella sp. An7]|uniref:DUF4012 domain-containing protein n=1 Tax=Collinsella sp. An7 TaxID=1965651 RepID=UPI001302E4F5|nr:DUF4012 domain-containing protein [Collinsella sp. An7]